MQKKRIFAVIQEIYHTEYGVQGNRTTLTHLGCEDFKYSNTTVHKYMKSLGIKSIVRRKIPTFVSGTIHEAIFKSIRKKLHG